MDTVTKLQKRKLSMKMLQELYEVLDERDVSVINLTINFNPYNFHYKLEKTHRPGLDETEDYTN